MSMHSTASASAGSSAGVLAAFSAATGFVSFAAAFFFGLPDFFGFAEVAATFLAAFFLVVFLPGTAAAFFAVLFFADFFLADFFFMTFDFEAFEPAFLGDPDLDDLVLGSSQPKCICPVNSFDSLTSATIPASRFQVFFEPPMLTTVRPFPSAKASRPKKDEIICDPAGGFQRKWPP